MQACLALLCALCLLPLFAHADESELLPVGIEVTTHLGDRQVFLKGDLIAFLVTLERDAHIVAVYVDAENRAIRIPPNESQEQSFYRADLFIPLPQEGAAFNFRVGPPYGEETLWLFASDAPPVDLQGESLANGLRRLDMRIDDVRRAIKSHARRYYGEAKVTVQTRER